jgi:prostamide/prostaglandin F2alpha synthase
MAPTIAAALAPITLPDASGAEVRLGSLWASRPAVLVFLRHYG